MKLFKGNIIYTENKDAFKIIENGYILEENGIICDVGKDLLDQYPTIEVIDYTNHLLIPGFVDLHFHAVQYGNLGLGLDEKLLDWLNVYTFKEEEKFKDLAYAEIIFKEALEDVIKSGTTRIVFFSSIHEEATKMLIELCKAYNIDAFVGKVNMDRNASEGLLEDSKESLEATKRLLNEYDNTIITPRFVPSCTKSLMNELGELSKQGHPVQTHISETKDEIKWVKSLHPEAKNYLDVYDTSGLVTEKTILAHCVFCTDEEKEVIKKRGAYVAHCPSANFNLTSGIMDVKDYIGKNMNVGLGTDVGAGNTPSIKNTIVEAIKMSKVNHMIHRDSDVLSFSEAFYLATKGGGSYFGNVGSFEKGYELDLLVIKPDDLSVSRGINCLEQLQRFVYAGHHDMIIESYCKGEKLNPYKKKN